ncbi:hypothetical protein ABGN05_29595 [Aquibium sp. LZ166]|uniref:Uncharacterized protein n=1 Tax=Aquibium pacificus TaxID=3153579 RepID=A0ABV3SSJ9_9HYPH
MSFDRDETPTPVQLGGLILPANVVRWLHERADYEVCSFDEAAARSIVDWFNEATYPARVEDSLQHAPTA